jgi:23S rRNA pseudouridine1911/1915/1917 synthase
VPPVADLIKSQPPPADGERLDLYLVRRGLAASRRAARNLVAAGKITVNGRRCRKGLNLGAADVVQVAASADAAGIIPDPSLPLEVLYAGQDLLVVNKPGGLPCHPLRLGHRPTLLDAIVARFGQAAHAGSNPLEGGLVHRLDNGTSGATMVALTPEALARLRAALKGGRIARRYVALVAGALNRPLELDAPIAHHPRNRRKMTAVRGPKAAAKLKARIATTLVTPVRKVNGFTLVEVAPRSGSRHQIRVHLATAGFPIAGDELYGGPAMAPLVPGRFFLHLAQLDIPGEEGSRDGQRSAPKASPDTLTVIAPLPPDLQACLDQPAA